MSTSPPLISNNALPSEINASPKSPLHIPFPQTGADKETIATIINNTATTKTEVGNEDTTIIENEDRR
jgi:hypothetical protein